MLKALEKDRTRRYETANGLAADLRRYLDNEPVAARPPSTLYRIGKLARRNKVTFAAGGAVVLALIGGLVTTSWQARRAERHLELARLRAYVSGLNLAHQTLADNNLARTLELLNDHRPKGRETDLRGFEWRCLWQLCQGDVLTNFTDAGAGAIEFPPDGRWLAYGGRGQVIIRDAASLEEIAAVPATCQSLSFSPDGRLLASADWESASVWDTTSWQRVQQLPEAGGAVLFSPDGAWLVTGQVSSNRIVLWERGTWRRLADCPNTPEVDNHMRHALAFSPDGKLLTTPWIEFDGDGTAALVLRKLPSLAPVGKVMASRKPLACATFDRETGHLLTGTWDGRLLVWSLEDVAPRLLHEFHEHSSHLFRIAVASGGKVMATAGEDQTVNLWERETYRHLTRLRGDTNQLGALAVSPDGRTVGAGSLQAGVIRLWRPDLTNRTDLLDVGSLVAGFTADSRTLVLGPRNGDSRWHLAGAATRAVAVATNLDLPGDLLCRPFDVTGNRPLGALGCQGGRLELWDLAAESLIAAWPAETNQIRLVAFSPDGQQLAAGSATGDVRLWNVSSHSETAAFRPAAGRVTALAYSRDGQRLVAAAGWGDSKVVLWDVATGRPLPCPGNSNWISWFEFSPDGRLLAAANLDGGVELWDLSAGTLLTTLKGHVMGVLRVAFSADGRTLVTGALDGRVKFWNLATLHETLTLSVPLGAGFRSLCFSPDGRTLAVGYLSFPGHHVRLYFAPSLAEIAATEQDQHAVPPR